MNLRSEEWASGQGREAYAAVTARAVGRLSTLAELAAPLLEEGGVLIAWKGKRDEDEEAQLRRAAPELAYEFFEVHPRTIQHYGVEVGGLRYDGPAAGIEDADDPVVRQFVRGELEGPL